MRANPIRDLASCASCYHLFNALSAPKSVKDVLRLNNANNASDVEHPGSVAVPAKDNMVRIFIPSGARQGMWSALKIARSPASHPSKLRLPGTPVSQGWGIQDRFEI